MTRRWIRWQRPLRVPPTVPGPGFAPRLHVRKDPDGHPVWQWNVWEGCFWHDGGVAATHKQALAVGMAALEAASVGRTEPAVKLGLTL